MCHVIGINLKNEKVYFRWNSQWKHNHDFLLIVEKSWYDVIWSKAMKAGELKRLYINSLCVNPFSHYWYKYPVGTIDEPLIVRFHIYIPYKHDRHIYPNIWNSDSIIG